MGWWRGAGGAAQCRLALYPRPGAKRGDARGHPRAAHCGAKVLVKKALPATRSCLTQTGSSGTKVFVHTIFDRLPTHLHIIHKSEHNINITCLFALAEKQFVMRALAEWNRSLGDPVSLCILHGLHARHVCPQKNGRQAHWRCWLEGSG